MTLYQALKKIDEVAPAECDRLSFGTQLQLDRILKMAGFIEINTGSVIKRDAPVPEELKRVRVTTTKPRNGEILITYSDVEVIHFIEGDYIAYDGDLPDSEIRLCKDGLLHLFRKVPKTLYVSKRR